jgi:rubredoxin
MPDSPNLPHTLVGSSLTGLSDDSRLECRICWYVYDPELGDDVEQIPPGTPFADLPAHWRCPQCDSDKALFLPIDED